MVNSPSARTAFRRLASSRIIVGGVIVALTAFLLAFWLLISQRQPMRLGAVLDQRAEADVQAGLDAQAQQEWLQAIRRDATYAPAYIHLGDDDLVHGRPREAAMSFTAATLLQPDDGRTWLHLAQARFQDQDLPEAAVAAQKATQLLPNNADAFTIQGQVQEKMANIGAAIFSLRRARMLAPENRTAVIELARTEITEHEMTNAPSDFLLYLQAHTNDPEACFLLAGYDEELPRTASHLRQALFYAQRARALAPDNPYAANQVGDIDLALNQPHDALRAYQAARQINPQSEQAISGLVRCETLLGQPRQAALASTALATINTRHNQILHLQDRLRLEPGSLPVLNELAGLEEADGNGALAESYFAAAVRQSPQNPQARLALAAFYRRIQREDLAQQALNPNFVP